MQRNNSPARYFHNNSSNSASFNGNKNSTSNYHSKQSQSRNSPNKRSIKSESSRDKGAADSRNDKEKKEQDSKIPQHEKKFTQRSRLFVGNLPPDITEQEFKNLFSKFGEISETFVNAEKGYGFVRMDTRVNAEKAKWELDGKNMKHNRTLRIRFATHGAALSVKNLTSLVSNELLEEAFQQFGTVERAVVIVDDRGRSTGRGIVEFSRKTSATKAIQQIKDGCFLLTSSPRAILATPLDQEDTEDGLPERNLMQNSPQYFQEREAPPRFAKPGTFEEEFARRWKALDDLERQQREELERNIQAAKEKLEAEMENAIHEHKTMMMKQDLLRRQDELNRLEDARKRELERRQHLELAREDARQKEFEDMQQQQQMLRAQIEGNFKPDGFPRNSRPGFMHPGGPPNPTTPQLNMLHDAITAQEMIGGRVGLGPAPSRFDQNMGPMGARGTPPMGVPQGPRGFGGGPKPGQRRGFGDQSFDLQKRRRF